MNECPWCTATRDLAARHGSGLLLADPEDKAAEAPELPQVRRAIEEDARNNRLTILNTIRPFHVGAGDKDLTVLLRCKIVNPEDEQINKKAEFHEMPKHNTSKFGGVQIIKMKYIIPECLKNVIIETTEEKDEYKEFNEQLDEYTKPEAQEDSNNGTDIAALMRLITSKFEDKQNETKVHVDREREDQIHNYGN